MNRVSLHLDASEDLHAQWLIALQNNFGDGTALDPAASTLGMLLHALEWEGSARQLIEATPFKTSGLTAQDIRDVLARLGFRTSRLTRHRDEITSRICPCLILPGDAPPVAVLDRTDDGFVLFDSASPMKTQTRPHLPDGDVFVIERSDDDTPHVAATAGEWMRGVAYRFRGILTTILAATLFINLLSLAVPLSIMAIYDQVIGKETVGLLKYLVFGVVAAAGFEIALRLLQARAQAFIGARLDYLIAGQVFEQVLHLSPVMTERAPVGGQITRIREFETFREFFSGSLGSVFLDLPFTLIFIAVIATIAGPLAYVPVALAGAYFLLGILINGALRDRLRLAGKSRSTRHAFLVEMIWWMRSLKQNGVERIWRERFRELSADSAWTNLGIHKLNGLTQDLAQSLMILSGAATLGFGVLMAMKGELSLGALIATMMLVWRVLSPIRTIFGLGTRIDSFRQGLDQLVAVLNYAREQEPNDSTATNIKFRGDLVFNRVSMRYTNDGNPAVLGLSFHIRPGETVGIIGDSGSGKSTVCKLALGLYQPQGGNITLDGIDIRQLRPITLRQNMSYLPQSNHAFPGSLLDNIRLADPTASRDQVIEACRKAGIWHKIEALPDGLDSRFKEGLQTQVPQGFLRQLGLARTFLRNAPVLVLDEPASLLEDEEERAFSETLDKLRGTATILMTTQRPSHMRKCDKLLVLREGQLSLFGPTEKVLAELDQHYNRLVPHDNQGDGNE